MGLTAIAIRRPLLMLMGIGALLVVGLVSWTKLGVDLLPALDFPIVVVTTAYPGASPEAVDTLVTRKIEDAVVTINDIDYIQSTSTEGVSSVIIFFKDKAPKDSSIDVERKVSAIWDAVQRATERGDWRPSPSKLCDWCDHQSLCPAFGGTPPELPVLPVPTVPEARAADERPSPHTPGDEV